MKPWWLSWHRLSLVLGLLFFVVGVVYVGNAWSPSSYGHVLRVAGAQKTGVVWGEPRAIRSDEWSVTTPLTQATVNNGLERINHTSYYNEDLRINYAMPIRDWGMVFKPTQWAYLLAPPAYAFSLHYFAMFALFVFGYAHLFRMVGATPVAAYLLSVSLYQTGFVQFFWNSNTSLFVFFPWLLTILGSSIPLGTRLVLFYWVATCWLIGNFYPPLFISLAFVALVLLQAYRTDLLKPKLLLLISLAGLAACGTAVFYLWDYLVQTINTSYPGQRVSAGGSYPWFMFFTQLWPATLFDLSYKESVSFTNVAGVGTVGLYWTLAALCFADWSRWRLLAFRADPAFAVLLGGWVLTLLWMFAPIPSWVGVVLLWNRVPPERMIYAEGLLLIFVVLHVIRTLGVRIGWRRLFVYATAVVVGWLAFESFTRGVAGSWHHSHELLMVPVVVLALWLSRHLSWSASTGLLVAGFFCSVVIFGRFNPIQSAGPIFDGAMHPLKQVLQSNVDSQGVLAVQREGLIGATLNGMGFRAVAHLNAVPPLGVWRDKFGELSAQELFIFNRYAHVRLTTAEQVVLLENDQVGVPAMLFREQPTLTLMAYRPGQMAHGSGAVDEIQVSGEALRIKGWAPWAGSGKPRHLILATNLPLLPGSSVSDYERWDKVALTGTPVLLSGFTVLLKVADFPMERAWLCVYARDGVDGLPSLLASSKVGPACASGT